MQCPFSRCHAQRQQPAENREVVGAAPPPSSGPGDLCPWGWSSVCLGKARGPPIEVFSGMPVTYVVGIPALDHVRPWTQVTAHLFVVLVPVQAPQEKDRKGRCKFLSAHPKQVEEDGRSDGAGRAFPAEEPSGRGWEGSAGRSGPPFPVVRLQLGRKGHSDVSAGSRS